MKLMNLLKTDEKEDYIFLISFVNSTLAVEILFLEQVGLCHLSSRTAPTSQSTWVAVIIFNVFLP